MNAWVIVPIAVSISYRKIIQGRKAGGEWMQGSLDVMATINS